MAFFPYSGLRNRGAAVSLVIAFVMSVLSACGSTDRGQAAFDDSEVIRSRVSSALAVSSTQDGGVAGMVVPGMAAGIYLPGRPVLSVPYGLADREAPEPLQSRSLFHVGSLTKTFTAALIMQLDQEKRLSIDDVLSPRYASFPNGENITLRMLLSHTSGIQSFTDDRLAGGLRTLLERNDDPPPQELLDLVIAANTPDFAPGARYKYSNTNYLLLGMIAEKVTGAAWHREIRSRFLDPLQLTSTFVYGKEDGPRAVAGYTICADSSCSSFAVTNAGEGLDWKASWAAGAIVSSAPDIATWMHALVAGDVLDPEHRAAMQTVTPQSKAWAATLSSKYSMVKGVGLCLFQLSYPSVGTGWGHEGQINGFSNIGSYFPEAGLGVSILTNLNQTIMSSAMGRVLEAVESKGGDLGWH